MDIIFAIVQIFTLDGTHPTAMQTSKELFATRSECEKRILDYTKMIGGQIEFKTFGQETIMYRILKSVSGETQSADICVKLSNQN